MNKLIKSFILMATALFVASCGNREDAASGISVNKQKLEIVDGEFTPEIMHRMGKISEPQLSPDGKEIMYGVTYTSIEENTRRRILYIMNADGSANRAITDGSISAANARWIGSGAEIALIVKGKLHTMSASGKELKEVAGAPEGIEGFELSPKGDKILYVKSIKACKKPSDIYPDMDKANARTIDDLMYRHWDHFVEEIPHTYVAQFSKASGEWTLADSKDIVGEENLFELPTLPFGGLEQLSWSPDESTIAYSCRKLIGKEYAFSTNTDIYLYNVADGTASNITEGMMGYDTNPLFSPDGKYIAWLSMERDGYEADKLRLFVMNLATGEKRELSADYKYNVESLLWSAESDKIYFTSGINGRNAILVVDINKELGGKIEGNEATGPIPADYNYGAGIRRITPDSSWFNFGSLSLLNSNTLLATSTSLLRPAEIVTVDIASGEFKEITSENADILAQLKTPTVKERWMTTTDGKQMLVWLLYPADFDESKVYPAIMMCTGGPQGALDQSFSTRWNFRLMASKGYVTILPNRRGCTSFGQPWCEQISGDYIGQNMKDYLTAANTMKNEPYVGKIGAVGASYGGYSIYYLAGIHNNTFSAFVSHAGIFNQEQMYMMTEEMWFPKWDNGGAPWDNNPVAVRHYTNSAHKLIKRWNTPILVTHGEMDYRVPVEQGMAAFNAAQMNGVESKMVLFPDENHWILQPQNSIYWHRVVYEWLDKYCK